jgi:alpha-glucosidase
VKLVSPAPFRDVSVRSGGFDASGTGKSRLSVRFLEDWLVRVTFLPDGEYRLDRTWMIQGTRPRAGDPVPREGRDRGDLSVFSRPEPRISRTEGGVLSEGTLLTLALDSGSGSLRWSSSDGEPFARDLPERAYTYDAKGTRVYHYLERRSDEVYYGFGERAGPLNKKGLRMEMRNLDALGYDASSTDPLYKHWPIYITFLPGKGIAYALIYDNLSDTVFDMGREIDAYHGDYRYYQAAGGDVEYYLVYGPDIPSVVRRITLLIGRIQLPPRWALGYLGSGMGYTDSPDVMLKLGEFVERCSEHRIPCSMFHLSSGYAMTEEGERWVFLWNRRRIPDPRKLTRIFHHRGIRVSANIKPCLLESHPEYAQAARSGVFLGDGQMPHRAVFWGGKGSYIDFTSETGYRWWQERVRERILENGVDGTWNDNNEYEIWDDDIRAEGFGKPIPLYLIRPLHALLMTRASYETQIAFAPDVRPYVLTRSGCPGIQRYAQTWTGDNSTGWRNLRYNIPMGLGAGLTGQPNLGHDVGGFRGSEPGPELFLRWVQNGIFHPRFSIHSWRGDGTSTEPWSYPEVLDAVREAFHLRYALFPYLYSLFCRAALDGTPILRPMVYEFPGDPRCAEESFDFLLGDGLLVASVLEEGRRSRSVHLPRETRWCDFYTGLWYEGGGEVELPAPLERPVLLARSGAVLPLGKVPTGTCPFPDDYRELRVFPDPREGSGEFELHEDDGVSNAYLSGGRTVLAVRLESKPGSISLYIEARERGYALPYGKIHVVLPPGESRPLASPGFRETGRDGQGRRIFEYELPEELTRDS